MADGGSTPIATVWVTGYPTDRGTLYRDGAHRYIVWADGCNDAVPGRRNVTEFGIAFRVVRRLRR